MPEPIAVPSQIPAIPGPTIIFVINRAWSPGSDDVAVYEATRGYWRVGAVTRQRAKYALGVAGGFVRGAYRIDSWQPGAEPGRWGFTGHPAPELGAVGTSVERLAPARGAANPVRLYLDGIPPASEGLASDIAAELNLEPLARIMYGQRELFHSNLLAWFFDALPDAADEVFRDLADTGDGTQRLVERERENLDLVLRWPGAAPLVIENKVFSLPDQAQLDAYRAKTARWNGTPPTHVLLSMLPPARAMDGWTYLSYQELAERIDLALAEAGRGYEYETMRHYSRMIRLLSALISTTAPENDDEGVWPDSRQLAAIASPQTRSALLKLRARRVQEALNDRGPVDGWTEAALSHSQPLVGWRRHLRLNGSTVEAGWQYQEGQFRLCAVLDHLRGRRDEDLAARASFAGSHPGLFDFSGLREVLGGENQPKPVGRFGHFSPDFVYRYVKAPDLTIGELIAASHAVAAQLNALAEKG